MLLSTPAAAQTRASRAPARSVGCPQLHVRGVLSSSTRLTSRLQCRTARGEGRGLSIQGGQFGLPVGGNNSCTRPHCTIHQLHSACTSQLLLCATLHAVDTDTLSFLDHQHKQASNGNGSSSQRSSSSTTATQPSEAAAAEQFDWFNAWYPVSALTALKQDAPNALQLLGMRLVVWWDKASASWRAMEDLCPHRCVLVCLCVAVG